MLIACFQIRAASFTPARILFVTAARQILSHTRCYLLVDAFVTASAAHCQFAIPA